MLISARLRRSLFFSCLVLTAVWQFQGEALPGAEAENPPEAGAVTISTDFPGGNAVIGRNEAGVVQISPDLRGNNPWFYWYISATAKQAGRVVFELPEKVAGFKNGGIGFQGPAISTDGGSTWRWMGTENVRENTFHYDFAKAGEVVRFAVTIPYVQADLKAFLKRHADNPHLKQSELTTSRAGRPVDLLQIGTPGENRQPVLVTARHHAAETIASYVLEGFLQEAMSDEPAGVAFRKRYVLFAVPLVDTDGVAEGDQGKNRKPWDHNRDYREDSIYPEVQAIMQLGKSQNFRFALDFHCPTLVYPDHQVMYFVGAKTHPQHNFQNVTLFAERIKAGLPKSAPHGPLVWLRAEQDASPKNSRFFGFQEDITLSATLEIPFAPPGRATDPASCRQYGQIMLKAFVETEFLTGKE